MAMRRSSAVCSTSVLAAAVMALALVVGMAGPVAAVPSLQVYVPGATYDTATETWVTSSPEFDLQVIGAGYVYDVKLAAALITDQAPTTGSITIGGSTFGPGDFVYGTPQLGDGSSLPPHGIYPAWYVSVPIGDFQPLYTVYDMQPGSSGSAMGEIKTIHVTVSGFDRVHFDVYDHVIVGGDHAKYVNNPFSHDGEYELPEPGTALLLGLGLAGLGVGARRRRR